MQIERFIGDIEKLGDLIKKYKESIHEKNLDPAQYVDLQKAVDNEDIIFFTAQVDDVPVGMCSIGITFSTYNCAYSGVFEDFYIAVNFRKSGLARLLTDYVFNYCKSNGISTLWVGCADCDIKMYQHLGFEIPIGNLLTWSEK